MGRTLAARFDILGLLGQGGMGAVYRAYDRELDDVVALKVIAVDADTAAELALERFRREVKLARRVTHPNVARTFELGNSDGITFCTMELIDGESLRAILRRGPLPLGSAISVTRTLCEALAAAHAVGVVHRDVKPDNILVAQDGRVVLADFGIAALEENSAGGTPPYMAPEQMYAAPTPVLDIYAVGVVLHEMVTGACAFRGTAAEIATAKQSLDHIDLPAVDPDRTALAAVIAKATARDPERRYATCRELAAQLAPAPVHGLTGTRETTVSDEVRTISVVPPVEDPAVPASERVPLYLANAVYEALLARLVTVPRLRIAAGPNRATLRAGRTLVVELASAAGRPVAIEVPASAGEIERAVDVTTAAISAMLANRTPSAIPDEARDLLLRARTLTHRATMPSDEAVVLLERAHAIAPTDPQIAATFAMVEVRRSFHRWSTPANQERATELVAKALAADPHSGEAHLAAGHVELSGGDVVLAAHHFRKAIACAPQLAEARESLGRLLLEAGFVGDGLRQIETGLANAATFSGTQWDVALAYALDDRWDDYDRLATWLLSRGSDRPVQRMRAALWRGDLAAVPAMVAAVIDFDRVMLDAIATVAEPDSWNRRRVTIVEHLRQPGPRRRRAFLLQVAAELAGRATDADTCVALLAEATEAGLFDLHWLDGCPLLASARVHPAFATVRARVEARALAIFDALYGDMSSPTAVDPAAALTRR